MSENYKNKDIEGKYLFQKIRRTSVVIISENNTLIERKEIIELPGIQEIFAMGGTD